MCMPPIKTGSDIILDKLLEGTILKPIKDIFDRTVIY